MRAQEKDLQARLDRLEELLAHQALTLDEMSSELLRVNAAHEDLLRRHKALVNRLEAVEETGGPAGSASAYEKPPHY